MNNTHRLIRAFLKQPVDRTPIWLMRQAGRYLPEYQKLRREVPDFLTLCKTPELACLATLQPLERFALDGAILFSDILTIPDAMGLGLHFVQQEGPKFSNPLRSHRDIENLPIPDPISDLGYVCDTLRLVKKTLNNRLPVIGFSGSPWTLASYMVEGQSSDNFLLAKKMLYDTPSTMRRLLEKLSLAVTAYLNAQIQAGADAVMLFDTWGGLLTTQDYRDYSLYYMEKIIADLNHTVPVILFTKHGGQWLEQMATSGCDVIGLDWTTPLDIAKKRIEPINSKLALQGNLDPAILLSSEAAIEQAVKNILAAYGSSPGHIFNLGHGILQHTPVEHVSALVQAVHQYSEAYHVKPHT